MKYIKFFIITFLVKTIAFLFISTICSYFLKGNEYHTLVLLGSYLIVNPIIDTKMKGQTLSFGKFFLVNFISILRTIVFLIVFRISGSYISNNFINCGIGALIVMLPGIINKNKPYLKTSRGKITSIEPSNYFNNHMQRQQFRQFTEENNRLAMENSNRLAIEESNRLAIEESNRLAMEESNRLAMEEACRACTPFEHGGYDMTQGNSFNNF